MHSARNLDARALQALYDEGYYHGVNSGYPAAGYESEHATWRHWVDHLAPRYHGGRWLDLGCAYGFLVGEARAGGFAATGVDVSAYALARAAVDAPDARGRLIRGCVETLPFADATFDVVSAFDVLEHLVAPAAVLAEVCRVLRPGGVLIGATPDPMLFDRHEETHFSEHPPAYWIARLMELGFAVDFRFFQADYNLELCAVRGDRPRLLPGAVLRTDGFATTPDLGTVHGPEAERVAVRLRAGFGSAEPHEAAVARWMEAGEGRVYLLVGGRTPVAVQGRLEARAAAGAAVLTVGVDDQRLHEVAIGATWQTVALDPLPLAVGGHQLRLRATAPLFVRGLELRADAVDAATLLARLPFDMYQRYDQARAVVARLPVAPGTLLDVGGALGGPGGHLAATRDFFPAWEVCTIDARPLDHPDHRVASGTALPFADASFDVVVCQDVLEHVAAPARAGLLGELARVARRFVLVAAPFATPGVRDADALLFALIEARHHYAHRFLAEHLEHGHPDLTTTTAFFRAAGARVVVLPNGHLPYWTTMQTLNLRLAEPAMGARYARAQAVYNGAVDDWREPAYRHLVVVDRSGDDRWCAPVRRLVSAPVDERAAAAALTRVLDLATPEPEPPAPAPADAGGPEAREVAAAGGLLDWAWATVRRLTGAA